MAQPGRRRQRDGLLALLLLLALVLPLSLARLDAAAVSAANHHGWEEGVVATALEEAVGQDAATAAAEDDGGRPERVEMEVVNDYPQIGPNNRHNPNPNPNPNPHPHP